MTVDSLSRSPRGYATSPELYFLEKGCEAHEFLVVRAGALRPARAGYVLVGILLEESEADEFILYAERDLGLKDKLITPRVRNSWANWKRFERPGRARRPRASDRWRRR
jgi:hypothetical protein